VTAIDREEASVHRLAETAGVIAKVTMVDPSTVERLGGGWSLIVAKQMIYYFDRREAPNLIASLRDALAPDGRLIVEIFNGALLSSRFTELKDPGILTAYTEHGLRRLLEGSCAIAGCAACFMQWPRQCGSGSIVWSSSSSAGGTMSFRKSRPKPLLPSLAGADDARAAPLGQLRAWPVRPLVRDLPG
jgi:hypothetical protein